MSSVSNLKLSQKNEIWEIKIALSMESAICDPIGIRTRVFTLKG